MCTIVGTSVRKRAGQRYVDWKSKSGLRSAAEVSGLFSDKICDVEGCALGLVLLTYTNSRIDHLFSVTVERS